MKNDEVLVIHIAGRQIAIRQEARKTLALRTIPDGLVALIPKTLDPASLEVDAFVERALAQRPKPKVSPPNPLMTEQMHDRVAHWAERVGFEVRRVQIRQMHTKWTGCSSQGNIALNTDILAFPAELVDYVIIHALLHPKFPGLGKGWQAMMSVYLPDWQEAERRLMVWQQDSNEATKEQVE